MITKKLSICFEYPSYILIIQKCRFILQLKNPEYLKLKRSLYICSLNGVLTINDSKMCQTFWKNTNSLYLQNVSL